MLSVLVKYATYCIDIFIVVVYKMPIAKAPDSLPPVIVHWITMFDTSPYRRPAHPVISPALLSVVGTAAKKLRSEL